MKKSIVKQSIRIELNDNKYIYVSKDSETTYYRTVDKSEVDLSLGGV
jgi:hypothetical protein